MLPFDSHNHVHMGGNPPFHALLPVTTTTLVGTTSMIPSPPPLPAPALSGMAIMSTHPRDYDPVLQLTTELPAVMPGVRIVPGLGLHPWFLHEVDPTLWDSCTSGGDKDENNHKPKWLQELEERLLANPHAIVGEIGLDGFHFDPVTQQLTTPMDVQVKAFRLQMELAFQLQRPVSIHAVHSFGQLMETLSALKKLRQLPPRIYFHAFGGKIGTVDQLLALCAGRPIYFGFAPIINFRSPKTADLVRKIGIDRLLLESDHEDADLIPEDIVRCIDFMATALGVSAEYVVERTTANAYDFYELNEK